MDTVDPVPTYFGTGVDVRGSSPAAGGLIKLDGISPLQCTLTKNAPVSPLESTVTKLLNLKSPGINSYEKIGGGGGRVVRKSGTATNRIVG